MQIGEWDTVARDPHKEGVHTYFLGFKAKYISLIRVFSLFFSPLTSSFRLQCNVCIILFVFHPRPSSIFNINSIDSGLLPFTPLAQIPHPLLLYPFDLFILGLPSCITWAFEFPVHYANTNTSTNRIL